MWKPRRTPIVTILAICVLGVEGLSACGPLPPLEPPGVSPVQPVPPGAGLIQSTVERVAAPQVAPAILRELVAGNTAFAFDLYKSAGAAADGNLFFSPHSISVGLAMPFAGARADTAAQMADTLHFTLPADALHPAFNALDHAVAGGGAQAPESPEGPQRYELHSEEQQRFELQIANGVWVEAGHPFLPAYLDVLARNYGAGLHAANFSGAPEPTRLEINAWVSQHTNHKIQDLIPAGALNELARLVLVNAIYFKAGWQHPFDPGLTKDAPFQLRDGTSVMRPMMSMSGPASLAYTDGDGFQAIELPYLGGAQAMDIILPDQGRFEELEASLTAQRFQEILSDLAPASTALHMPPFAFSRELDLSRLLIGMGMTDAFDASSADFSGMDGTQDLFVQSALHKAFVAVDEDGTEAAAATAGIMSTTMGMVTEVELTLDRPFVFVIRDLPTGTVLFVGRILDPAL